MAGEFNDFRKVFQQTILYYILWLVNNKHYFHTFTGAKGKVGSTGNNYKENQGFLKSYIKSNYQTNLYWTFLMNNFSQNTTLLQHKHLLTKFTILVFIYKIKSTKKSILSYFVRSMFRTVTSYWVSALTEHLFFGCCNPFITKCTWWFWSNYKQTFKCWIIIYL